MGTDELWAVRQSDQNATGGLTAMDYNSIPSRGVAIIRYGYACRSDLNLLQRDKFPMDITCLLVDRATLRRILFYSPATWLAIFTYQIVKLLCMCKTTFSLILLWTTRPWTQRKHELPAGAKRGKSRAWLRLAPDWPKIQHIAVGRMRLLNGSTKLAVAIVCENS